MEDLNAASDEVPPLRPAPLEDAKPSIELKLVDSINYAAWQNSVPFLQGLQISNPGSAAVQGLSLELTASPAFCRPKVWRLERIDPKEVFPIRDLDVPLDPDFLNGLDEAERGLVRVRLLDGDSVLAESEESIRILARNEWGGMVSMGELLAAFVTPNDPAISRILKSASEVLARHGHSSALDGYQSGDPSRAYMLAAAIWSAVGAEGLTYSNPPRSFENIGQKTRRASAVLDEKLATCLDSTLLFASALEAIGLNAVIVMKQGHCFVGVWLVEKTLNRLIESDCSEIRKAAAARELVNFETTLITHSPPGRFQDAIATAASATSESEENDFVAAIDIQRARMAQIRPLASHSRSETGNEPSEAASGPLPLPSTPRFDALAPAESDEAPTSPEGRIDRWQRKLLDLSLRNRLLNFKATSQVIPVVCPDVSLLEDRLADGTRLRLISLKDQNPIGGRNAALHQKNTNQDLDVEFCRQALDRNEVACSLTEKELSARLTNLYRKVRNDLSEGGSNTLFLAVGFLKWKQSADEERIYRAPLLLVPVKLLRKSAASPFSLAHHEDDVRFNATLIQLLKKDFDCDVSHLESNLPTDDSGVDVPFVLERMRRAVRDIPGFEVVDETAISTFSFAKYLMWKDLVDRVGELTNNRVVRHLIEDPEKPFYCGANASMPSPNELDVRYHPGDMVHPLPADSSQLAAVMAAAEGHDFVLVGPPGTGKSQTIANIVAQCLASGKTVLFVAEKTAALDVVHRRLKEYGLGDCCVELHSNKAERRSFLDQMQASWENNRRPDPSEWHTVSERLRIRRDELNTYVAAIHSRQSNGWTPFQAMGVLVSGQDLPTPPLHFADAARHDAEAYERLTQLVADLALTYRALDRRTALPHVRASEWSAKWEAELLERSARLKATTLDLQTAFVTLAAAIGLKGVTDFRLDELTAFTKLARVLRQSAYENVTVLFNKHFSKLPNAVAELRSAIEREEQARGHASGTYAPESLEEIPIEELDQSWRAAKASLWPKSWLSKRKIARLLQSYAIQGTANPESDLRAIREMREQRKTIAASLLAETTNQWQAENTDTASLEATLNLAREVREAIVSLGKQIGATETISKALYPLLSDESGESEKLRTVDGFLEAAQRFSHSWKDYTETARAMPVNAESPAVLADVLELADRVQENRTSLRQWTAWRKVEQNAEQAGLKGFVEALETGSVEPSELSDRFKLAYARWWLPQAIDSNPAIRNFQQFKHEAVVDEFRRLDELSRATAASRVKQAIAHDLPASDKAPRKSELGLLRHQMGLKRPSKSIREVISAMPDSFSKLAPCLLMSPLSIAQYLPASQTQFDVVVFDEASQITTWDAIGAIARAKQTIIVGDPKQLPPTNFFGKAEDDADNDELDDFEKDLESILDEAEAAGLPKLQLNWHYRSRNESLITFSNHHYYGNKLITFPSPATTDTGVTLKYLEGALFDRGKSRTNRAEAEAIVADAVARMKACFAKPESERLTYGVITFNLQQQTLIQDLFDEALRKHTEIEWFFSDDRVEPTVVKNLENVQGDERDVMYFSITFGFDSAGRFPVNFGALNRDGGERRLNVAVTRARRSLLVYSSFRADQLKAERSQARGVHHLKNYLEYAERGPVALAAHTEGSLGEFDSPFEEAVSEALASRGWQVEPQIGVSGFRVDLGVVHPDKPGVYLAGVECDGATYHRSAAARDRDKIRQQILEALGWNIVRIWSTDWWYDPSGAAERTHAALTTLLQDDREPNQSEAVDETSSDPSKEAAASREARCEPATLHTSRDSAVKEATRQESLFDTHSGLEQCQAGQLGPEYVRTDLPDLAHNQDCFFDESYTSKLRELAEAVIANEAPIREDLLARQVARAHGFRRTGAKLRNRILGTVADTPFTDESTGRFLWNAEGPQIELPFRRTRADDERRSIDQIAMAELRGLVRSVSDRLDAEDPALLCARELGLSRLANSARERIEEAISLCQDSGA